MDPKNDGKWVSKDVSFQLWECFKHASSWGWHPSLNKWHGCGNPQSFHTVWVLNSWDATWYSKTRTAIKCSSSPSSLSRSIAPSPSPTNLKQTLNGYIGLSSNNWLNDQLNHWHGSIKFPYWHTSSLHYSNQQHLQYYLCHICDLLVLYTSYVEHSLISMEFGRIELLNIKKLSQKSAFRGQAIEKSWKHPSTSTTRHLCHCMGFLTSFRAPVLHGVDRWPHPNDQNLCGWLYWIFGSCSKCDWFLFLLGSKLFMNMFFKFGWISTNNLTLPCSLYGRVLLKLTATLHWEKWGKTQWTDFLLA